MKSPRLRKVFSELEGMQSNFFRVQGQITDSEYIWPLEPLYEWSRRVEYPYVASEISASKGAHVLDAGSGVTFFPIYLREKLNMRVECLDMDPTYADRMEKVCRLMGVQPPIPFHIADLAGTLPLPGESFDAVVCISVLEHLPASRRLATTLDLWRLVAPGGRLILTLDVSLADDANIGLPASQVKQFALSLADALGTALPVPLPVPAGLLTPQRPGQGFFPLRVGNDIVRRRPRGWLLHTLKRPLRMLPPLGCLLCSIPKPKGG